MAMEHKFGLPRSPTALGCRRAGGVGKSREAELRKGRSQAELGNEKWIAELGNERNGRTDAVEDCPRAIRRRRLHGPCAGVAGVRPRGRYSGQGPPEYSRGGRAAAPTPPPISLSGGPACC